VAWIEFHDGFEQAIAPGRAIDESVDAYRSAIVDASQFITEHGNHFAVELVEPIRDIARPAEECHLCGRRRAAFGAAVGLKRPAVVDQTGVAAQVQTARLHFQLDGEIQLALEPGSMTGRRWRCKAF
jgi:hypothetical protein